MGDCDHDDEKLELKETRVDEIVVVENSLPTEATESSKDKSQKQDTIDEKEAAVRYCFRFSLMIRLTSSSALFLAFCFSADTVDMIHVLSYSYQCCFVQAFTQFAKECVGSHSAEMFELVVCCR